MFVQAFEIGPVTADSPDENLFSRKIVNARDLRSRRSVHNYFLGTLTNRVRKIDKLLQLRDYRNVRSRNVTAAVLYPPDPLFPAYGNENHVDRPIASIEFCVEKLFKFLQGFIGYATRLRTVVKEIGFVVKHQRADISPFAHSLDITGPVLVLYAFKE